MVKVSSSTEFPQSPDAPEDGKFTSPLITVLLIIRMSVTLGYVGLLRKKDDHGLKIYIYSY